MKLKIDISETKGFKPHRTLLSPPFSFETPMIKGCVFYLAADGKLGGDSFIVKSDKYLTVSLLEDMTAHGRDGRNNLCKYVEDLEKIIDSVSLYKFNKTKFFEEIIALDKKVNSDHMIAFSLIRILPSKHISYVNIGENEMILYKNGQIQNISEISEGKIGMLRLRTTNEETITNWITPHRGSLTSKDRVLLCSDGVIDYSKDTEKRRKHIENLLASQLALEKVIKQINQSAKNELKTQNVMRPYDDYTIISIEVK